MSNQTIEQRIDEILRQYPRLPHEQVEIKQALLQLLNETRIDELKQMWNNTQHEIKPLGADDILIDPSYITERIAQLTPKEDK